MIGVRRVVGWVFAGMTGSVCMLLVAPVGSATSLLSVPPPPSIGESSPGVAQLLPPPFTPEPAAASTGTRISVIGSGFAVCAAAHGAIESSESVSVAADGDASVYSDGVNPIPTVPLDAQLGLSAILGISQAVPGEHQVVRRCGNDEGEVSPGEVIVIPPPDVVAVGSDRPVPTPAVNAVPAHQPVEVPAPRGEPQDAALASGDPAGGTAQDQLSSADPLTSSGSAKRTESLVPASGPASLGSLIGVLFAVGAVLVVPTAISFALQARKGPNWVRANVQAVASAAPVASIETTPQLDGPWPPTFGVQLALRTDNGTQAITEVEQ